MSYLALMEQDMGLDTFAKTAKQLTEDEARDAAEKLILEVLCNKADAKLFEAHGLFPNGPTVMFRDKDNGGELRELKPRTR